MKCNLYEHRKGIHVKLNKDTHAQLRIVLFKNRISMQELFEEFALSVINGESSANSVIKKASMKKIKSSIEEAREVVKNNNIDVLDQELLYDLISARVEKQE